MSALCRVTPLGSGGWIPTPQRHTCCYLVELGSTLFIFDLGTGVCRLTSEAGQKLLEKYDDINILVSHYHLDHIIGITYLPAVFNNKFIRIFAPGPPLYQQGAAAILNQLVQPPYFALTLGRYPMDMDIVDICPGKIMISGYQVEAAEQIHSAPSLGFKIDNVIAYLTDTCCGDESAIFFRKTRILLHEVWSDAHRVDAKCEDGHSDINSVTRAAMLAGIETLIPIHLNPSYSEQRLKAMVEKVKLAPFTTVLPHDGKSIEFQFRTLNTTGNSPSFSIHTIR